MGDRSSRRLNALNRSIDRKLDQIDGHQEDALSASKSRVNQGTGKSRLPESAAEMPPRMIQKKRALHPLQPGIKQGAVVSPPSSSSVNSPASCPRVWSQQGVSKDLRSSGQTFQARYNLNADGGYSEQAASDFRLPDSPTMVVEMGDLKMTTGDELIQTFSMSDCSSIVLLTDFDLDKKIYGKRCLVHMQGSNLACMEDPEKIADTLCAQAKASSGRPLMILATGIISSPWMIETLVIPVELSSADGAVRRPLMELMSLCDAMLLPLTLELTVWPDGSLLATHDYTTLDSWVSGETPKEA